MPTSLLVVDDFLGARDALALREAGLRLTYPPDQKGAFPGRNSVERVEIDGLTEAVSRLVGEKLRAAPPPQSHAKFRITLAGDVGRAKVHIDKAHWSGVLYLSRPEDCRGGTEFFRHLPTQSDRAPMTDQELAAAGFSSQEQMYQEIVSKHTVDDSKWEMTMRPDALQPPADAAPMAVAHGRGSLRQYAGRRAIGLSAVLRSRVNRGTTLQMKHSPARKRRAITTPR